MSLYLHYYEALTSTAVFSLLMHNFFSSSERHCNSQDPQVHDEPTASEEANGKGSHVHS